MKLREWYASRGPQFIYRRGARVLDRYRMSPTEAMDRIERFTATLAKYGCAPTFPTPGIVVQRYPHFIRHLQDAGVEIAVHGYQHVNLNAYPVADAKNQLV